jgi:dsRNA-specific ribonuclease
LEAFEQLDYLGDAVLRLLAYRKMPSNPNRWETEYANNQYLASLYDRVILVPTTTVSNVVKRRAYTKGNRSKRNRHFKASCVEGWLGVAYKHGGLVAVEQMWERLHNIPN